MEDFNKDAAIAKREAEKLALRADRLIIIKTPEELKDATNLLAEIKRINKNIAERKNPIIKNLLETMKQVRDLFRAPEERLVAAEKQIKDAMLDYHQKLATKAHTKAQRVEEKVDAGEIKITEGMAKISKIEQAPTSVQAEAGSIQFRFIKKVRITDVSALPPRYFMRERVVEALRLEVADDVLKKHHDIPAGAEVYEVKVIAGGPFGNENI
jgi:hypothetical protein